MSKETVKLYRGYTIKGRDDTQVCRVFKPDGTFLSNHTTWLAAETAIRKRTKTARKEPGIDNDPQCNSVENADAARIESQSSKRGQHFVD